MKLIDLLRTIKSHEIISIGLDIEPLENCKRDTRFNHMKIISQHLLNNQVSMVEVRNNIITIIVNDNSI